MNTLIENGRRRREAQARCCRANRESQMRELREQRSAFLVLLGFGSS
jgi:hypothetical protein